MIHVGVGIKKRSMIEVSEQGAQVLGKIAVVLAHGEGLQTHAPVTEMRHICDCVAI